MGVGLSSAGLESVAVSDPVVSLSVHYGCNDT